MGGSELGDDHLDSISQQNKTGFRTSAREKKPINYSNMNHGTGDINTSMDYSEVGGSTKLNQKK